MGRIGFFKRLSRNLRERGYLRRQGGYRFCGLDVSVPDDAPFSIKKSLMEGTYEEPERQLIETFLRRDLPVIELGGSLGFISAFVDHRLAPDVPYVVVEANAHLLETCRRNAQSGRGAGATQVLHAACAYGAPTISFMVSDHAHASRLAEAEDAPENVVTVPAVTLSDLVKRHANDGPYSLIMDIESGEWDVLEHDGGAFAQCDHAIIEIHPAIFRKQGRTVERFMEMTREAGLKVVGQIGQSYAFARAT